MTQAKAFGDAWFLAIANVINDLETLRTLNDRVSQEPALLGNALTAESARTDITSQDMTNASSAITQLLFTFDSGTPTQKSYLFKML
jgi:hypothetical protein